MAKIAKTQLKNHAVNILLHGIIGSLLGFLFFHPASRIFHELITTQSSFSFKQIILDCLSSQHFPLGIFFAVLGLFFGVVHGLYSYYVTGLLQRIKLSSEKETINAAYEQIFQKPATVRPSASVATYNHQDGRISDWVKGKPASLGYAVGNAKLFNDAEEFYSFFEKYIDHKYSLPEFELAIKRTADQIVSLKKQSLHKLGEDAAMIFDAHLAILKDKAFVGPIANLVKKGEGVPQAMLDVTKSYIEIFDKGYLQDRVQDVKDIVFRIMRNLTGEECSKGFAGCIVVAHELFPSNILQMAAEGVSGIILFSGGINSHNSILARSLHVPLVIVDAPESAEKIVGSRVLIDAQNGDVCINPTNKIIESVKIKYQKNLTSGLEIQTDANQPTITKDGIHIGLMANINLLSELESSTMQYSEGIGLCRTELLFVNYRQIPTEEEQYRVYRTVVEQARDKVVTFRTFDLGGDKNFWNIAGISSENPLLGIKSIRLSLRNRNLFIQQIRAILKAASNSKTRIMFPMISSVDEFEEAKRVVTECIEKLRKEGKTFNDYVEVGIMLEVPSVLEIINELSEGADFLSLGTNDFVQYLLAADRNRSELDDFYLPHHPSVLRSIKHIVDAASKKEKPLCVCGDMAHESNYIPYLLGIGIRQLSVEPIYLAEVRKIISETSIEDAQEMAQEILGQSNIAAIYSMLLNKNNISRRRISIR